MSQPKLNVGDVVRVKGINGPQMLVFKVGLGPDVSRHPNPDHTVYATCYWFDVDQRPIVMDFQLEFLEAVPSAERIRAL